ARGASPDNSEVQELSSELDTVNAALPNFNSANVPLHYSYYVIFSFTARRCCRRQHGHLGSAATSLKASGRRMEAIELGTCHSGRTGSPPRLEPRGERRGLGPP